MLTNYKTYNKSYPIVFYFIKCNVAVTTDQKLLQIMLMNYEYW